MRLENKRALIVIIGSSKGIGREVALQISKLVSEKDSVFFLLSRNEKALTCTKEIIQKNNDRLNIVPITIDLSLPYKGTIDSQIKHFEEKYTFDLRLIVHNAGTLGDMTRLSSELNDEEQWHLYIQTNLISTIHINNKIFNALKKDNPIFIVNITSLLSIKPFSSFTQYSVAKAAREAFFRSFAIEHPKCRVLSYSPGPVDTDMHTEVCKNSFDENVRQVFSQRYENGPNLHRKLLTCTETVTRFLQILEKNKFENGSRVDYFDDINN